MLTRWDPFRDLKGVETEFDRMVGQAFSKNAWVPALDIAETEERFAVTIDLPGMSSDEWKPNVRTWPPRCRCSQTAVLSRRRPIHIGCAGSEPRCLAACATQRSDHGARRRNPSSTTPRWGMMGRIVIGTSRIRDVPGRIGFIGSGKYGSTGAAR